MIQVVKFGDSVIAFKDSSVLEIKKLFDSEEVEELNGVVYLDRNPRVDGLMSRLYDSRIICDAPEPEYWVTIYKPVRGWTTVLYGQEGPYQTGIRSYATPQEAYEASKAWAKEEGIPFTPHVFGTCTVDGHGHTVDGRCDECDSIELTNMLRLINERNRK